MGRRSRSCRGCGGSAAEVLDRLGADTFVVMDTHWEVTFEHIITGHEKREGIFTSHELPRGMRQIPYEMPGDPELAYGVSEQAEAATTRGCSPPTTRTSRSSTAR